MCGRFSYFLGSDILQKSFSLPNPPQNLTPRYNIAPNEEVTVIVKKETNIVQSMKWGLIPFWAPDKSIASKMINARSETVWDKNAFKQSIKQKRCIIPSSGFYEWKREGSSKIPYFIKVSDQDLMPIAGIYDYWYTDHGYAIVSFAIITTEPNSTLEPIHDRMPVILHKDQIEEWLDIDTNRENVSSIMRPYEGDMVAYAVSSYVNNPSNKSEQCMEEVTVKKQYETLDDFF